MKAKKGDLLIAEPSILNDSSFQRSIILLTEHNAASSVGFILNRSLQFTLNDILPDIDCNFPIYQGGPVEQDNLYFVHKVPDLIPESINISKDLYWGGNFDSLRDLLINGAIKKEDIRFFLGYSGWGKGQLTAEIAEKSWFVAENDFGNILSIHDEFLWKNMLLKKGGKYKLWANAPSDISLN